MREEQSPRLDYANPKLRSRPDTMTAIMSLIFNAGIAIAVSLWVVWINEWRIGAIYLWLAVLLVAFALWQVYRSVRTLLRSVEN